MILTAGTHLDRDEIRSQLGASEMDEVYLAHRLLTHRRDFFPESLRPPG